MSGELSLSGSVDHLPAFSVNPPGILVVTRHWDDISTWLTIKHADPEVRFSDELLNEFADGGDNDGMYPDVELDQSADHHTEVSCPGVTVCFTDCVLRIHGRDRTVIYRIGDYVPVTNSWIARWPD